MANNKLYTKSYFCMRLRNAKIDNKLIADYSNEEDSIRKWSVLIYPDTKKIICTCYKNNIGYWFKIDSKNQINITLKTDSMNVIIEFLQKLDTPIEIPPQIINTVTA